MFPVVSVSPRSAVASVRSSGVRDDSTNYNGEVVIAGAA